MNLRQNAFQRTILAPAKLNLYLEVLGRRADGFHELETLMVPIWLFDSLSMAAIPAAGSAAAEIRFRMHGIGSDLTTIPADRENLVVHALELFRRRSGCPHGAEMALCKRIPSAAGLGGGSSDAAAALKLANRLWNIGWSIDRLAELAAEIGSDVPFFMSPGAAICRGRGEIVTRLPSFRPLHVVVVKPPAALSTREVYRRLTDSTRQTSDPRTANSRQRVAALTRALEHGNLTGLGQWMSNRLQAAADVLSPWVDRVRQAFAALDFVGHQLSGSGSAYFGICRHAQHARRLGAALKTRRLGLVFVTTSCR